MVSNFGVDEGPVYEGYFELGFRDRVLVLVANISETLAISPCQLNPPAWRTLIALQNLGLPAFAGNWTEKFAFMRLPGFLPIWQLEGRLAVGVTKVL